MQIAQNELQIRDEGARKVDLVVGFPWARLKLGAGRRVLERGHPKIGDREAVWI